MMEVWCAVVGILLLLRVLVEACSGRRHDRWDQEQRERRRRRS